MALILSGRLAANIQRVGAIVDERLPADSCRRILADSHLYLPMVREAMDSLEHGRANQVLRSRGLAPSRRSGDPRAIGQSEPQAQTGAPAAGAIRTSMNRTGNSSTPSSRLIPRSRSRIRAKVLHAHPEGKLEAIVARRRSVRNIPGLRVRYVDVPLPAESLQHVSTDLGLGTDVYVASPSLVWLLATAGSGFGPTVAFALELCGSYALQDDPDVPCSYGLRPAVTPYALTRGIQSIADAAGSLRVVGLTRCAAACPYVLANAASPMESAVATMLSLPLSRGGYGIGSLVLNDRIDLTERQRVVSERPYLSVDGRIAGQPLGYEYDSDEFHSGADRESRDRARLVAAQSLGYTLLPLTRDIVCDERRFEAFGEEFARLAGRKRRLVSETTRTRRSRLREELGLPNATVGYGGFDDLVPLDAYDL